jgi:ribosomal-protein-alanine N-acetyltransferase
MLPFRRKVKIETERMTLRLPTHGDWTQWAALRDESAAFLTPWEPVWPADDLTRSAFRRRLRRQADEIERDETYPFFLFREADHALMGGLTIGQVRRGVAQAATLGYWMGQAHARQGYMREAILSVVHHAFTVMDLSRVEAACLPENTASRGVLEKCGFKYEGVAQSYLQIAGRWRNHVLYANLRGDRRGRTDVG